MSPRPTATASAFLAALCMAPAAQGASVTGEKPTRTGWAPATFRAGGGEANRLTISEDRRGRRIFHDRGAPLRARGSCVRLGRHRARCLGTGSINVFLGARNDRLRVIGGDSGRSIGVSGGGGADYLVGGPTRDNFKGRGGNDRIRGGGNQDVLGGDRGNDVIKGGGGHDFIHGETGTDNLEGRSGRDEVVGGDGNDRVRGGFGRDVVSGHRGNDRVMGGEGDDRHVAGGNGDDVVDGGDGNDGVSGDGDDVDGDPGRDLLLGGDGQDTLAGSRRNDVIRGGADDDTLNGYGGDDQLDGRAGNDTIISRPVPVVGAFAEQIGYRPEEIDTVICGGEELDRVLPDARDLIRDCASASVWTDDSRYHEGSVPDYLTLETEPVLERDTAVFLAMCAREGGCRGELRMTDVSITPPHQIGTAEIDLAERNPNAAPQRIRVDLEPAAAERLRQGIEVAVALDPDPELVNPPSEGYVLAEFQYGYRMFMRP